MWKAIFISALLIASCTKSKEACKCYEEDQYLILRDCEDEKDLAEIKLCSQTRVLEQVYSRIEYPEEAKANNVQGTVVIGFTIDRRGELDDFKILWDTLGNGLGDAGLEAAKTLRELDFCPCRKDCRAYDYQFVLPIKFLM